MRRMTRFQAAALGELVAKGLTTQSWATAFQGDAAVRYNRQC
jgi:hypothetical protein